MEKEFPDILKEYLISENITQTEFARRTGFKSSQVNEWLKGKAKPAYDNLKKISVALEISADYWWGLIDTY